jgi:hypothetical protein
VIVLAAVGLVASGIMGLLSLVFNMGMRIVAMTIATTLSIFLVLWFLSR